MAAFAIILIRGLDLLMILNLLGLQGLNEFIHRSVQTCAGAGGGLCYYFDSWPGSADDP
ncbi:YbjO family protein [Klebsiella pneumoniae]